MSLGQTGLPHKVLLAKKKKIIEVEIYECHHQGLIKRRIVTSSHTKL